jgi:aspartyl-tRNA(Asn)/glutamyl-tRNA(Gln) amidotransferase subunit B
LPGYTLSRVEVSEIHAQGTSGKFLLKHLLAHPSSRSTKKVASDLQLLALASTSPSTSGSEIDATSELQLLCESAVTELPSEVAAVRAGNKNVLNKIVGHVMKKSRGRADATATRKLVEQLILGNSQ